MSNSIALVDWRLPVYGAEAVRFCAEHHVSALQVDFGGPGHSPSLDKRTRQDAILEACAEHKVHIISLAGNQLNDIGLGLRFDRYTSRKLQNLIESILDTANYLSVPLVFFPSFHRGAIRDIETLVRAAKMLRWACQEAKDRQLELGSENDLSVAWSVRLIEEVCATNFRFIFDCYNPIKAGHSAAKLLTKLEGCFASQVHIKDGFAGEDGKVALGSGDGNVKNILTALVQTDWAKDYILENDYRCSHPQALHHDIQWISHYLTWQRTQSKSSIH